jgi:hypothetical protein
VPFLGWSADYKNGFFAASYSMLLGSTSNYLVQKSSSPVMVSLSPCATLPFLRRVNPEVRCFCRCQAQSDEVSLCRSPADLCASRAPSTAKSLRSTASPASPSPKPRSRKSRTPKPSTTRRNTRKGARSRPRSRSCRCRRTARSFRGLRRGSERQDRSSFFVQIVQYLLLFVHVPGYRIMTRFRVEG